MAKSTEVWINPDMSVMETYFIHIFWKELYERILEASESEKEEIDFIVTGEKLEDKFYDIEEVELLDLLILKI